MKILVTGATGFIGKNLVDKLVEYDYEIIAVVRKIPEQGNFDKKIKFIKADLQEIENIQSQMSGVDVVIHMAAQLGHYGMPYEYFYKVNYMSSVKLAQMSIKNNVKQFILCSAPFVVGLEGRNTKEDEPYAPTDFYSKTKMLAEQGVMDTCRGKIPFTILRPSFVYGIGDVRRTTLYRSIKHKHFILTTSGKSYLHPSYVTDIVDGFVCSILNPKAYNEIFNLGAENDCTSKEYLNCIAEAVGSKLIHINIGYPLSVLLANMIDGISKKILKRQGFVSKGRIDFLAKDHSCDISKAKKVLGYTPKISVKEGVLRSVKWAEENGYL